MSFFNWNPVQQMRQRKVTKTTQNSTGKGCYQHHSQGLLSYRGGGGGKEGLRGETLGTRLLLYEHNTVL